MIIVFKQNATVEEKTKLKNQLESKGFQIHASDGVNASLFGVVGDTSALDINLLRVVEGVEKVMRVQEPFKRANRMFHPEDRCCRQKIRRQKAAGYRRPLFRRNPGAGYGNCQGC